MSRYENWLRWRVTDGTPPEVVTASRSAGRKLLGALMRDLELSGNMQGIKRQTLPDGTELVARFDGTTPVVEITAKSPEKETHECKGLFGAISDPVEVQDWPRWSDTVATQRLVTAAAYGHDVYAFFRQPASPTTGTLWGLRRFDPAGPAMRDYGVVVENVGGVVLAQPAFVFRNKELSDAPLMTNTYDQTQVGLPEYGGGQFYQHLLLDVTTGQFGGGSTYGFPPGPPWVALEAHGAIQMNRDGVVPGQLNTIPFFWREYADNNYTTMTGDYVGLSDTQTGLVRDIRRSVTESGAAGSPTLLGIKDGTCYVFGYAQTVFGDVVAAPAKDVYAIDFDTGATTHHELPFALSQPWTDPLRAQICDTMIIAGGTDAPGHRSGDVWLYKLGIGARKIGNVPELEGDMSQAGITPDNVSFSYLVATFNKMYLFTPRRDDTTDPSAITGANVRVIT